MTREGEIWLMLRHRQATDYQWLAPSLGAGTHDRLVRIALAQSDPAYNTTTVQSLNGNTYSL